jgi:hypothetical protein
MEHTVAWILNLEADMELADPVGFAPSGRLVALSQERGRRFLTIAERGSEDLHHAPLGRSDGAHMICQSWCPTPRARSAARAAGASLPDGPPLEVLQTVNHRSFSAALTGVVGGGLPGARFVRSMAELEEVLAGANPSAGWLLKRPFGFSGRGRKRVRGPLRDGDLRWAEASMHEYGRGLQVEPFVEIEEEFVLHSWLGRDGSCLTGNPARLVCDQDGAWLTTERASDLAPEEERELRAAHDRSAEALGRAGYFGPFATDAFRWRDGRASRFQPLSEINARYTMGWFAGFGDGQREWLERIRAEGA